MTKAVHLATVMAILLSGCVAASPAPKGTPGGAQPLPTAAPPTHASGASPSAPPPTTAAPVVTLPTLEITMPVPANSQPAIAGETPSELLLAVKQDLAQLTGVGADEIQLVNAQAVTWPDGSLGCPQPGVSYTQALVPGYQLVLRAAAVDYVYHAGDNGAFKLCRQSNAPGQPEPINP